MCAQTKLIPTSNIGGHARLRVSLSFNPTLQTLARQLAWSIYTIVSQGNIFGLPTLLWRLLYSPKIPLLPYGKILGPAS